jgi:hypothetical protein
MTRILFLAASLGLAVSGAQACDFMKSAAKVDANTTASVSKQEARKQETGTPPMSTPATVVTAEAAQGDAIVVQQSE